MEPIVSRAHRGMTSTAVERIEFEHQEMPRSECTAASQVSGSRRRHTVFTIGGVLPHTLHASMTELQKSKERQHDESLFSGAMRRRPAAALRRLGTAVSGAARSEDRAVLVEPLEEYPSGTLLSESMLLQTPTPIPSCWANVALRGSVQDTGVRFRVLTNTNDISYLFLLG